MRVALLRFSASKLQRQSVPAWSPGRRRAELEQTIVAEQPRRNRLNGQVIMVLLLVAVPLLALLIVQQGRVIDAQKLLIRQLSSDSQQLNAFRVRELQNRNKQGQRSAGKPESNVPRAESSPQPGAAPEQKNLNRPESKRSQPHFPQEYPGARPMPTKKSA